MSTELASGYLTRKQLAQELGTRLRGKPYTEGAIRLWERAGSGPPMTRVGGLTLYCVESVEKWLRAQEVTQR